jgi:hypothetical protein
MLTEEQLQQELADLRAAVVCAKETKQAQEEHYLRQIIKVGFDRQRQPCGTLYAHAV